MPGALAREMNAARADFASFLEAVRGPLRQDAPGLLSAVEAGTAPVPELVAPADGAGAASGADFFAAAAAAEGHLRRLRGAAAAAARLPLDFLRAVSGTRRREVETARAAALAAPGRAARAYAAALPELAAAAAAAGDPRELARVLASSDTAAATPALALAAAHARAGGGTEQDGRALRHAIAAVRDRALAAGAAAAAGSVRLGAKDFGLHSGAGGAFAPAWVALGPRTEAATSLPCEITLGTSGRYLGAQLYDAALFARKYAGAGAGASVDAATVARYRVYPAAKPPGAKQKPARAGARAADPMFACQQGGGAPAYALAPRLRPAAAAAHADCAGALAAAALAAPAAAALREHSAVHDAIRASEGLPLKTFERVAVARLRALASALAGGAEFKAAAPEARQALAAAAFTDPLPAWAVSAADAAYATTAELWADARSGAAASEVPRAQRAAAAAGLARERAAARAVQTAELAESIGPIYASYWRARPPVFGADGDAREGAAETLLRLAAEDALAQLRAELSRRRADLLTFREPIALSAAAAAARGANLALLPAA
jgi:hypothetical protein